MAGGRDVFNGEGSGDGFVLPKELPPSRKCGLLKKVPLNKEVPQNAARTMCPLLIFSEVAKLIVKVGQGEGGARVITFVQYFKCK